MDFLTKLFTFLFGKPARRGRSTRSSDAAFLESVAERARQRSRDEQAVRESKAVAQPEPE